MTSWSYSAYSAAVKCLRYYQHVYVDRLDSGAIQSGDLAFGSALHSALNGILTGEDGTELFQIYWEAYQGKDLNYGRFNWEQLAQLGANFIRKFTERHAKRYLLKEAEVRLYGEYRGIKLEGTPDFIGSYDGRGSLRDFKSSGYAYPKEKQAIALQLNLYSFLAISNGRGTPETLGYTVFSKGTGSIQDLTWEFSEQAMYAHLDSMVEYCKLIESTTDRPKQPNSCIMGKYQCDYFKTCWEAK